MLQPQPGLDNLSNGALPSMNVYADGGWVRSAVLELLDGANVEVEG